MEELRNCMQRCQVGASLWERARTMVVPIMNVCLEEKSNEEMFVPTASMAAQMNDESDAQTLLLLQRLGASSDLVLRQSVLPDLIEVRLDKVNQLHNEILCCFFLTLLFSCRSFTFGYMEHLGI